MTKNFKSDFPILRRRGVSALFKGEYPAVALSEGGGRGSAPLVYLDSAATSQKPQAVIDAEKEWYECLNANVHRSAYALAEAATAAYEKGRGKVAEFIGARRDADSSRLGEEIVFTKGTTEAINLVAQSWAKYHLKSGDTILLTEMEHHANIVPWQLLAAEKRLKIKYWPINDHGELSHLRRRDDVIAPSEMLKGVKLISLTHISNVLGTINPIEKIIKLAHQKGIKVLIDAAQSVPHMPINVSQMDPDFLAFSSHKMLGPTGLGCLYIKKERHSEMHPYQGGGEMIEKVTYKGTTFKQVPHLLEAGTQPLAQVYGLTAAIDYLQRIGMKKVWQHNAVLTQYAYSQLSKIPEIKIIGPSANKRGALIAFTVEGIHPHDLATFLDQYNICLRAGHHCAQPLHDKLGITASARISFHIYNNKTDIDHLIKALKEIIKEWGKSVNKLT